MSQELMLAMQITLVGMGIVFAAIILLGVVMAALVRLTADHETPWGAAEPEPEPGMAASGDAAQAELARKRRAAAAAVAVALLQTADSSEPHAFPMPPTPIVSAWQTVMRTRNLNQRGPTR